ncbi:MAG: hypothetical protein AABY10_04135 [Nanoarchaeota archaeon]
MTEEVNTTLAYRPQNQRSHETKEAERSTTRQYKRLSTQMAQEELFRSLTQLANLPRNEMDEAEELLGVISRGISAYSGDERTDLEIRMDAAATAHTLGDPSRYRA